VSSWADGFSLWREGAYALKTFPSGYISRRYERGSIMLTKIKKWGNSPAVRIPKTIAEEIGIENGTPVEIRVVDGQIHITPIQSVHYELEALLSQITPDNLHDEIDTRDA
jgi:antitoxin MazE